MIRWIRSTLHGKLIALTLGLSIVPLLLVMVVTGTVYYRDAFDRQVENSITVLEQTSAALSTRMSGLEMATMMAIIDKNVRVLMTSDAEGDVFHLYSPEGRMLYDKKTAALNFFTMLEIQNSDVYGATLLTEREIYYKFRGSQMYGDWFHERYRDYDWYRTALERRGRPVYIGPHTPYDSVGVYGDVVSVARSIFDASSGKYLGTILVDAGAGILEEVCGEAAIPPMGAMVVLDDKGTPLFQAGEGIALAEADYERAVGGRKSGYYDVEAEGKKYLLSYVASQETGWYVTQLLPYGMLIQRSLAAPLLIIAGMALVLVLIVVGNVLLMRTVTKPITELNASLERVGQGDLHYGDEPALDRIDEIGDLAKGLQAMKKNLNELIHRLSSALESEKEAELLALQNQINPHFIHNTLSSIQMMAKMNGDDKTADMLETLGKLFHTQISRGRKLIPLGEELEIVDHYMALQAMRYEDKISYRTMIPEDLLACLCPKFSIQPLVENAINHGLECKPGQGSILVSAHRENEDLVICVEDDGLGISDGGLAAIRNKLEEKSEGSGKRIGIKNVHDRLRLYFGDAYGISLSNTGMTRIEMRLPLVYREEETGAEGERPPVEPKWN